MKKLVFIMAFFGLSFISAQPPIENNIKRDTVVVSLKSKDKELITVGMAGLRHHIDSLNNITMLYHHEFAIASKQRDSVTHAMLFVSLENDRLREAKIQLESDKKFLKNISHYSMLFFVVVAGSLISLGFFNYLSKYRKNEH